MKNSLVSIWTNAGRLVVLATITVGAIVEGSVPLPDRSSSPLVHKVPVETREGPMLSALSLNK